MGDVTDLSNFMGAVIDDRAFAKHKAAIARARRNRHLTVLAGGQTDDSVGYFVRPTLVQSTDPTDQMFTTEYFGPILAVHVYDDARYDRVLQQMESFAPYALTGSIIAQDREAIAWTPATTCASPPATSTSTTSPPAPSSASSPSAARVPPAPTTRPAPRSTCSAGPPRARSRRRSSLRRTGATRTWGEPAVGVAGAGALNFACGGLCGLWSPAVAREDPAALPHVVARPLTIEPPAPTTAAGTSSLRPLAIRSPDG